MNFLIVDICFHILPCEKFQLHETWTVCKPGFEFEFPNLENQYSEHAALKNEMRLEFISCICALSSLCGKKLPCAVE